MTGYFASLLHHTGVAIGSQGAPHPAALRSIEVHERRLVESTSSSEAPSDAVRAAPGEARAEAALSPSPGRAAQAVEMKALLAIPSPAAEPAERQVMQEIEPDETSAQSEQPSAQAVTPEVGKRHPPPSLEQEIRRQVPSQGVAQVPADVRGRRSETPEEVGARRTQVWRQVYEGVRQWVASSPEQSQAELVVEDERVTLIRARSIVQERSYERPVLVSENQELQLSIGSIHVSLEAPTEERRPSAEPRTKPRDQRAGRSRLRRHYLRVR